VEIKAVLEGRGFQPKIFGKVPTIEVNGELLYETAVITEYLDATLADRKFSFSHPMLQARMRQIMAIIDSYLFSPAIGSIVVQRLIFRVWGVRLMRLK